MDADRPVQTRPDHGHTNMPTNDVFDSSPRMEQFQAGATNWDMTETEGIRRERRDGGTDTRKRARRDTMDTDHPGPTRPSGGPWPPLSPEEAHAYIVRARGPSLGWDMEREHFRMHDIVEIAIDGCLLKHEIALGGLIETSAGHAVRFLDWYRTSYEGYDATGLSTVEARRGVQSPTSEPVATSPLIFALLWRAAERWDGPGDVSIAVVQWLWINGATIGPVPKSYAKDLLTDSILYEVAADFGVALLRACIHETQDPAESLTAPSGVSLIWLAMVEDRFDLASEMARLGAPLHSSPNLLYSDLTAPAFDRVARWAEELLHTRATYRAPLGDTLETFDTHPAEGDEARNFWPLLRQGGNTHPRALIAAFLGVATGVAARRLRLTHERMGPILARRRDRNETIRELAAHATEDVTDDPSCTWLMLNTSPPFTKDELPTLLLEHLPQQVDHLTLLPTGGESRPSTT